MIDFLWNRLNGWKRCKTTHFLMRPLHEDDDHDRIRKIYGGVSDTSVLAVTHRHARNIDVTPALTGQAVGLKCDAAGCGWSDMTIPRSDYPKHIDAPCPECGSNILTRKDWKLLLRIERGVEVLNWLNRLVVRRSGKGVYRKGNISMRGDGRYSYQEVPEA